MRSIMLGMLLLMSAAAAGSDHGIYTKAIANAKGDVRGIAQLVEDRLTASGFTLLNRYPVATPDIVREDEEEQCGFRAELIVFESRQFTDALTSFGNKYLVGAFLRIAIYETPAGVQVVFVNPETISRVIFNDLYENEEEESYAQAVAAGADMHEQLLALLHAIDGIDGEDISVMMEPIRSDEDLAESSKDMFMMVGPMTFFNDEDQFPVIYTRENADGLSGLEAFLSEMRMNLSEFQPSEDDIEYRLTASPEVLQWREIGIVYSPDSTALLLGISRPRTEGLSFHIAGSSRQSDEDLCPGIDHACAYPIEILITQEDGNLVVRTAREMFRMDMYFWDAGMGAFMAHMSMPSLLDESIRAALLGGLIQTD